MSVYINWEVPCANDEDFNAVFERVVARALRRADVLDPVEVNITIVAPEDIKELNASYREVERVTDVLSFPQWDIPRADGEKPDTKAYLNEVALMPGETEICLGDIVICLERAMEQAEAYGHSLIREMAFLCAHSMLHLFGYDHMTPADEKTMFAEQEMILEEEGIGR